MRDLQICSRRLRAPAAMGGKKPFVLADHADRVHALLAAQPDATLDELRVQLAGGGGRWLIRGIDWVVL